MRAIIRVIKRETTDEEAIEMKKAVIEALKKYDRVEVQMDTMG